MSSHNEPVKPISFDTVASPAGDPVKIEPGGTPRPASWTVPALLALIVIAVVVVFWLPSLIAPQEVKLTAAEPTAVSTTVSKKSPAAADEASPWSDAQQAKLRKTAQNTLADLLDLQSALEEQGVEQWAAIEFEQAKSLAAQGDQQYRERLFEQATQSYAQGVAEMQVLLDAAPAVAVEKLAEAKAAIEAGEQQTALEALAVVALIEPGSEELATLQHRAEALTQLLPLLEQALAAESAGELAQAQDLLQQGSAIDPLHLALHKALERVSAAYINSRFNAAMSRGYLALDGSQFKLAKTEFKRAAQLQPGAAEAASALLEVAEAETAHRLIALQRRGQSLEAQEQWQDVVASYEQALQIDSTISFAREGLARSEARAKLDKQFRAAISQPQRLGDEAVAGALETLVRQAASINPQGPLLQQQLAQLNSLLEKARTPIAMLLRSDMETEVTLLRVSRLGRFDQRNLNLRPGTYTAVGSRNGYRDVRKTFTLSHASTPPSVTIACTEKI